MSRLSELPNIGNVLAKKLVQAGVESAEDLVELGAENAFIRLQTIDPDACLNMLCALEGAVQGVRWHQLPTDRKEALKTFHHSLTLK